MTTGQYYTAQDAARKKSFLGTFENQEGRIYCTVYNSEVLTPREKGFIQYDADGQMGDVWNQIAFMTPSEFKERSKIN